MSKSSSIFKFKQFDVINEKSAMKVNTDSVLLGAWADVRLTDKQIWDVGSGTGLIALMLSQRSNADVSAIEIENNAFDESISNFRNSKWSERIMTYHADICDVWQTLPKPQLIVSNPPFFDNDSTKIVSSDNNRAMARHEATLSFKMLIYIASQCLTDDGRLCLIAPFVRKEELEFEASMAKFFPCRITSVRTNSNKPFSRVLMSFSKTTTHCIYDEIAIYSDGSSYSVKFKQLVKDFYLNVND